MGEIAQSCGQSSRGKLFERSISAAYGAILFWAKARTVSRSMSMSLPRPKSRPGKLFWTIGRSMAFPWPRPDAAKDAPR
jgi:hypothetical protein